MPEEMLFPPTFVATRQLPIYYRAYFFFFFAFFGADTFSFTSSQPHLMPPGASIICFIYRVHYRRLVLDITIASPRQRHICHAKRRLRLLKRRASYDNIETVGRHVVRAARPRLQTDEGL